MLDLWFSEFHAPDAKLSILVKEQLYSEQTPFQKIDFFDSETFGKFFTLDAVSYTHLTLPTKRIV